MISSAPIGFAGSQAHKGKKTTLAERRRFDHVIEEVEPRPELSAFIQSDRVDSEEDDSSEDGDAMNPMQGIFSNEIVNARITSANPKASEGRDARNRTFMVKISKQ